MAMAPELWDLEEVVGTILAWLPPVVLPRARLVCRMWNRIIASKQFRSNTSVPCCYLFCARWEVPDCLDKDTAWLFDPRLSSWARAPVPKPLHSIDSDGIDSGLSLVPSTGNSPLVCFVEAYNYEEPPPVNFWVGNPVANTWKLVLGHEWLLYDHIRLPNFYFVATDGPLVSYKIVAVGSGYEFPAVNYCTVIYDSHTEEWRRGDTYFGCCFDASYPGLALSMDEWGASRDGRTLFLHGWPKDYPHPVLQPEARRLREQEDCGMLHILCYDLEQDRFYTMEVADARPDAASLVELRFLGFVSAEDQEMPLVASMPRQQAGEFVFHQLQRRGQGWEYVEAKQVLPVGAAGRALTTARPDRAPGGDPATITITGQVDAVWQHIYNLVSAYGPYGTGGIRMGGEAERVYVRTGYGQVAMYDGRTDTCVLLPQPISPPDHQPGDLPWISQDRFNGERRWENPVCAFRSVFHIRP